MDHDDTDEDQLTLNLELFVAINCGRKRRQVTEEKIIDRVKECLSEGADIDAINHNDNGNTILHVAIKHHYDKVIRFLLKNGPKVDITNGQGLTALTLAQNLNSDPDIINLLENCEKSITTKISITYLSKNHNIWNKLRYNTEIAVLEVNSVEFSPDFLQQVEFYDAIDTAGNLFFVEVIVSDMDDIAEGFIICQLNRLNKQLILQCGSLSHTKVYCRGCESEAIVINLNSPIQYFDEKSLTDKLSGKEGFGLGSIVEALKLNLVGKFQTEQRSLLSVGLDLEKDLSGWKLIDYVIKYGDVITARWLSQNPWNLSKLNSSKTSTLTLAAQHGDIEKLAAVLRVKFPIQLDNNICLPNETAAHFDKCKKEMLESVVRAGNCDVISFMIRCGVQLDEDIIQLAWDNKHYDVVLVMLRADCVFPYAFDFDKVDVNDLNFIKLRRFVKERDDLHNLIKEGHSNGVKEFLKLIAPSKLYLNKENRSAVYTALKFNHFNVFVWLKSELKAEFKDDMERRSLGVGVLDSATDALVPHFVPIDNAHILHLVAKSRCRQNYAGFKDHIESIYIELNAIPQISTVLKVIQFCDNVDIIYDFEKDSIVDVNVASSENVTGFCEYKVGRIYIGAKVSKQELLGTVAHELTHLAIQTIFDNDCKPYKLGDSMKEEFDETIKEIREQSTPVDPIIFRVFSCYGESGWASELIVRVNHMLACYGSTDGLNRLEVQAKSLLEFYTKNVEKLFDNLVSESHLIKPRYLIKVLNDNAGVISKIDDSRIKLKKCIDVREVFGESEVQIAVVTSSSPFLSTMSVYQSLNEISQQPNSFLIFYFDGYLKRRIEINQAFYSDVCNFLILLCESVPGENSLSESLKALDRLLWKKSDKKVIFIMENSELLEKKCNQLHDLHLVVHSDVAYTLDDVRVDSAQLLLDQSVSLQCRDANIKLSSLIDEEHYKLVDAQTLLKLINKQPIVIGKEIIASSNYDQHFYIDRSFNQVLIKEEILRDEIEFTMYALSEIDEESLGNLVNRRDSVSTFNTFDKSHNVKYVIMDSGKGPHQYEQLCQQFPQHNIHWLKKVKDGFNWLKSRCIRGDLTRLQAFFHDKSFVQYSEGQLTIQEEKHRVFIVSNTAGMGKSTVLTSIAQKLTKLDPSMWVIRINLNDYSKVFDKEQEKQGLEIDRSLSAFNFLVDQLLESRVESRLETEFERNLLLHFLQHNEDRVVIMFDGFDEIKETHQNVIKDVLVALKSSKVKQMWVTTRPHMRETLENTLHHLSYTLQPLVETDQVSFLTLFWRHRLHFGVESSVASGCSSDTKLQCFAEALINMLSESISDREKVFTGVPLQLRMVAECFEEDAENICKSDENLPRLPPKLNLNDLFQDFFIRKYTIFQEEKNEVDFSKLNWESQNNVLKEVFINNHQIASLFTLFDERECELLLTTDQESRGISFINEISKHKISTGLIDLIIEGKPRFVHLTFAEYMAAEFTVNLLATEQPSIERNKLILTKVLIEDSFKVVRAFIDSQLAQKALTDAVLKKHGKVLRSIFSEKLNKSRLGKFISGVFGGDNKSRFFPQRKKICRVLHVACEEGNANLANFLLNCVKNCNIRSKLIKSVDDEQMRAVHLAAQHDHLDVVKVLVEHKADIKAVNSNTNILYEGFNALSLAAFFGNADICEWLISNGADINATVSGEGEFQGYNVLDIALQNGHVDVVQLLKNVMETDLNVVLTPDYRSEANITLHTAVYMSAGYDNWDMVKWIISEGLIDINEMYFNPFNMNQKTVLIEAVECGPPEMIEWLIEHNADVNVGCTDDGDTALHKAVRCNKLNVAKMLVNSGANVNAANCWRQTPLHRAAELGHEALVKLLLTVNDVDVNAVDSGGWAPLHYAARNDKLKVLEILLGNGAHVNAVNDRGVMPLHVAAVMGCDSVVEFLLKYKDVDVNATEKDGLTPLHLAAYHDQLNVVKILLSNNANVSAATSKGESPLHLAVAKGFDLVVEFLSTVKDTYVTAVDEDRSQSQGCSTKIGH